MDFEFDELRREFLLEAATKVGEIDSLLGGEGLRDDQARNRALYLAHQLKGAGGSYGFATISTEAAALEAVLETALDPDNAAVVSSRLGRLREAIELRKRELERTG